MEAVYTCRPPERPDAYLSFMRLVYDGTRLSGLLCGIGDERLNIAVSIVGILALLAIWSESYGACLPTIEGPCDDTPVVSNNYENDVAFIGAQVSREGIRHGFGFELSGNFSRVNDRGYASHEHIQVIGGLFLSSRIWSKNSAKIIGQFATGLAFSSRQFVDGDDFDIIEPAVSLYIEPRLVARAHQKYWRLRPSIGIGYIAYVVRDRDVEFSAARLHFGFSF